MESNSNTSAGDSKAAMGGKTTTAAMDPSLPLKYQKLLSEYSKLRNQVLQLTRCLADEQKVVKTLKDDGKEKEKAIKKLESEIESNSFRQQQLTKRISVLQEELKKKTAAKGQTQEDEDNLQSTFSIFDQELTSKIKEVQALNDQLSLLQTENLTLKEDMHELHLQNTDHEFMIRSQEEVIQSQKVMIDNLSHPVAAASSSSSQPATTTVEDPSSPLQVSQLKERLETADSKAALFSNECTRLKQRLDVVMDERQAARKEVEDLSSKLQSTQDQLSTCVRNYEQQLETMSEHLATMTEKWSQQQLDMEDQLQEQLNRKKDKKKSSTSKFFTDS